MSFSEYCSVKAVCTDVRNKKGIRRPPASEVIHR